MEILQSREEAQAQTDHLEKMVDKISNYVQLLRNCRIRIYLYKDNISRHATLKRAESRILNRISVLGKQLKIS